MFTPPDMIMNDWRSVRKMKPSSSTRPTSPHVAQVGWLDAVGERAIRTGEDGGEPVGVDEVTDQVLRRTHLKGGHPVQELMEQLAQLALRDEVAHAEVARTVSRVAVRRK